MNPDSSKYKIAFTGTNCSGKTTMALEVTARLKSQHILAEVVSSQDRKITWKDEHFPIDPRAHYGMISNLVNAEVQAELKGDAEVVITDRSVLDLFAIAITDHPDRSSKLIKGLEEYVLSWVSTYTKIYYLSPLPYQVDGKRPSDDFRLKTHSTLLRLIEEFQLSNVVTLDRVDIYQDILKILGKEKPQNILAEAEKWQYLVKLLRVDIIVKKPNWPTTSDVDIWLLINKDDGLDDLLKLDSVAPIVIECLFGDQIKPHVMAIPSCADISNIEGEICRYNYRSDDAKYS